jgi:hypothetical protein
MDRGAGETADGERGMQRRLIAMEAACAAAMLFGAAPGARAGDPADGGAGGPVMLFPILKGGKWGYMDGKGRVAIEPQYQAAWDFHEGLACVAVKALRGYIDPTGAMVIKPQFGWAGNFSGGLAFVNLHKGMYGEHVEWYRAVTGTGFCDKTGKVVIRLGYNMRAADFSEGVALSGKGFIDPAGKAVSSEAEEGDSFAGGMAAARKGAAWGYIARDTMKFAIEPRYAAARPFSDGMAAVAEGAVSAKERNLKWGYVDGSGKQVIECRYEDAGPFSEGLAPVRSGGKWGYADRTGKMAVEPQYEYAWRFSEGLGRVLVGEKHGYVDTSGKTVIVPAYDAAWEFDRGLARVGVGEKEGYINREGKLVWEPTE